MVSRRQLTSDRKKPGLAFWATVVVVAVLVTYVLSIGPAYWIEVRFVSPSSFDFVNAALDTFYCPIFWVMAYGPDWIARLLYWWIDLGQPDIEIPQNPYSVMGGR